MLQGLVLSIWSALLSEATVWVQTVCVATAVYHEARGEPEDGQHAVAWVVLNRVADPRWPDRPCDVVYQRHQFAWTRHNPPIHEPEAFEASLEVALLAQQEWRQAERPWLWFYDPTRANPRWARRLAVQARIGGHIFLADP